MSGAGLALGEIGKSLITEPRRAYLLPVISTSGRIYFELGEERRNLALPPSQLPLLLPVDLLSRVPSTPGMTCPFSVL